MDFVLSLWRRIGWAVREPALWIFTTNDCRLSDSIRLASPNYLSHLVSLSVLEEALVCLAIPKLVEGVELRAHDAGLAIEAGDLLQVWTPFPCHGRALRVLQ